jgi:HEAT repeat protein
METAKTMHRRGSRAWLLLSTGLLAATLGVGCAAPLSVKAAAGGDLVGLKAAMAQEKASGKLDRKRVTAVAKAVAEREIRQATGADALARIEEARVCWRPLVDSLEERARRSDDPGAGATLALLDGRSNRPGDGEVLQRKHATSPNPLWRAVAARAAVGGKLGEARRKFYPDPDERVRLAALRAALEWPDPADSSALLEAARLDPNPVAQGIAARAAGGVASAEVVVALRDRYATADEGLRQSIVDAWGRPELAKVGGRREIVAVAENERGAAAIEAGGLLLQMGGDVEARAIGQRALLRAMTEGLSRDRVLAIGRATIGDRDVLEAMHKAARDPDVPVKIAALTRLGEVAQARTQAWAELRKLADGGARDALFALAQAGDPAAIDGVTKELSSTHAEVRLRAMTVLVTADRFASAADLLADAHPGVRMRASCAVLSARSP